MIKHKCIIGKRPFKKKLKKLLPHVMSRKSRKSTLWQVPREVDVWAGGDPGSCAQFREVVPAAATERASEGTGTESTQNAVPTWT